MDAQLQALTYLYRNKTAMPRVMSKRMRLIVIAASALVLFVTAGFFALPSSEPANMLKAGDKAPEFSLPDQDSNMVSLTDLRGKWVVVYFYPKDDTPGCTKEACSFRDSYADFQDAGAVVYGVSIDSPSKHRSFRDKHNLPFSLLSDNGRKVGKAFGVPMSFFFLHGRTTFVIDPEGVIQHTFNSQVKPKAHIAEALSVLKSVER